MSDPVVYALNLRENTLLFAPYIVDPVIRRTSSITGTNHKTRGLLQCLQQIFPGSVKTDKKGFSLCILDPKQEKLLSKICTLFSLNLYQADKSICIHNYIDRSNYNIWEVSPTNKNDNGIVSACLDNLQGFFPPDLYERFVTAQEKEKPETPEAGVALLEKVRTQLLKMPKG